MMIMVFGMLTLQISANDNWNVQYTSFTSNSIVDNQGWWVQGNNGLMTSFCNGVSLFGGYNTFGSGTIVSKQISLPPHFKIRVSLEFWKIDSWDDEYVYFILDDYVQTGTWHWSSGDVMCGNQNQINEWREVKKNFVFEFSHQEPTLAVIILTTLDEYPDNESWGFRNFKVEVILCSPGCLRCNDDTPNECWYYELFEMNWFENFNFDGWNLDNQHFHSKSLCVNIWVIGGVNQITSSQQLSKQFTSLIPHYKIILELQLWKFDVWNNNQFLLEIDDQISASTIFNQFEVINICGNSNGGEKLLNIRVQQTHTSDSLRIMMKSNLVLTNGSWGLRAFRLFVVKCYETCLECTGQNKNECSVCKPGYKLYNFECVDVKWIFGLKEYFSQQDFQIQTGWTISNVQNNQSPFQICDNSNIVGGFNLLAKDASIALNFDLPRHTKIRIKLQFWKFDSWDNEWFQVFADGIKVYQAQFGLSGVQVTCGSSHPNVYRKNLDFDFVHDQSSINLIMTSNLDQNAGDESWGIRNFELLYGVQQDCSYSIINNFNMPSFLGTKFTQSNFYSTDQSLQNKLEISELGISLLSNFDQTINVDSGIKTLTIQIIWECFQNDITFSISILQSNYPDYRTETTICKQKRSNILSFLLQMERTIIQQSSIRLLATSTSFQIFQIVESQNIKLFDSTKQ